YGAKDAITRSREKALQVASRFARGIVRSEFEQPMALICVRIGKRLWRLPAQYTFPVGVELIMDSCLCRRSNVAGVVISAVMTAALNLCLAGTVAAQTPSPEARIAGSVENDKLVTLRGNVHRMAQPANDRGALAEQQPVTRMHLLLQRS